MSMRKNNIRGVGLLDALIALVILSFGVLGMVRFQGRIVSQSTEAQSRQVAVQLSDELLSTVLVDVRNAACYTLPQTGVCGNAAAVERTKAWAARVEQSLPGPVTAEAILDTAGERLTITLGWLGKGSSDTRTLTAVTDVRP
jgi:type IV pilus assembly protein PilV